MYVRLLLVGLVAFATGCSFFRPHRIDIYQGNVIEQEAVEQLQIGMTRRQVAFLMGTPLLEDPFRADRWDYVYSVTLGWNPTRERHLALFFENDQLVRFAGEMEPPPDGPGVYWQSGDVDTGPAPPSAPRESTIQTE